jgi:hypothetical protein
MDNRIYLDNCSFNRPYDDQTILRNYLEAEAKTYIQRQIINKVFELAWSYMMDYEISFNPFDNRRNQIQKWKSLTKINVQYSEDNVSLAKEIQKRNIKVKDSIHIACAIDPINFIKQMGA